MTDRNAKTWRETVRPGDVVETTDEEVVRVVEPLSGLDVLGVEYTGTDGYDLTIVPCASIDEYHPREDDVDPVDLLADQEDQDVATDGGQRLGPEVDQEIIDFGQDLIADADGMMVAAVRDDGGTAKAAHAAALEDEADVTAEELILATVEVIAAASEHDTDVLTYMVDDHIRRVRGDHV